MVRTLLLSFLFIFSLATAEEKPLVIGMELSYPPFETIDKAGNPTGISVEMAHELGQYLHRPVSIQNIPYVSLIPSLKNGKIDLIISSLTKTPEREKSIAFSKPYLKLGLALLVAKNSKLTSVTEVDQPGKKVAVKLGSTSQIWAQKHLKQAELIILDKESTAVMEVIQGKSDVFIYDQLSIYTHWRKHPETTRALLTSIEEESWAIGVRKDNQSLLNQVNAFIDDFRKMGGFAKLSEKYLKEQKQAFEEQKIPFVF